MSYLRSKLNPNDRYNALEYANNLNEFRMEMLASDIRKGTRSIPDIDLERYFCPECGKQVKYKMDYCKNCSQLLEWGFMTAD